MRFDTHFGLATHNWDEVEEDVIPFVEAYTFTSNTYCYNPSMDKYEDLLQRWSDDRKQRRQDLHQMLRGAEDLGLIDHMSYTLAGDLLLAIVTVPREMRDANDLSLARAALARVNQLEREHIEWTESLEV